MRPRMLGWAISAWYRGIIITRKPTIDGLLVMGLWSRIAKV